MTKRITLGLLVAVWLALLLWPSDPGNRDRDQSLRLQLEAIVPVESAHAVACAPLAARHPVVILALGQSNAANHGTKSSTADAPIPLIAQDHCTMATDPLPGSTGSGGSIWLRLSHLLTRQAPDRPWVMSVMGIDATSIGDWTQQNSPLRHRLRQQISTMQAMGFAPQLVLWQQGEADARLGTSSKAYREGLEQLAAILDDAGLNAPILMARSTVCRSAPDGRIRSAMELQAQENSRFLLGPDTDTLTGTGLRSDGCHFSSDGLDRAAQLWAASIAAISHVLH